MRGLQEKFRWGCGISSDQRGFAQHSYGNTLTMGKETKTSFETAAWGQAGTHSRCHCSGETSSICKTLPIARPMVRPARRESGIGGQCQNVFPSSCPFSHQAPTAIAAMSLSSIGAVGTFAYGQRTTSPLRICGAHQGGIDAQVGAAHRTLYTPVEWILQRRRDNGCPIARLWQISAEQHAIETGKYAMNPISATRWGRSRARCSRACGPATRSASGSRASSGCRRSSCRAERSTSACSTRRRTRFRPEVGFRKECCLATTASIRLHLLSCHPVRAQKLRNRILEESTTAFQEAVVEAEHLRSRR
jgi:hypothetical protein